MNLNKKIIVFIFMITLFSKGQTIRADETTPTTETNTPDTAQITNPTPDVTPTVLNETVLIRNGDTVLYSGTFPLPNPGTVNIIDDTGTIHAINSDSVLGLLYAIDQVNDNFSISDIQYYNSFNSLYLKCITPENAPAICNNWQYLINNMPPTSGMDVSTLTGGEKIGIYFGNPHQVIFDTTNITEGKMFTATAQKYNYENNTWDPLSGVKIGVTVVNLSDPYNPTVITTQQVDINGTASIMITDAGIYNIGIADDYYFPSYTMTVTAPPIISPTINHSGGGGVLTHPNMIPTFNIEKAFAYIESIQANDGSFEENDMYTDWASIALSSKDNSSSSNDKIISYMKSHPNQSLVLTDNERHSMALLALGQNPYSFSEINYIAPIIKAFDGTQFGDSLLINDDIFALIPLVNAGYTNDDDIIKKDITFILSKQKPDGSWDESIDITASAIQALVSFNSIDGVLASIKKASEYLQNSQNPDGGFGSVYSTAWALQAMNSLNESWEKNGNTPKESLARSQVGDGGVLAQSETKQNRIWATSYAIPAMLSKPWNTILHKVPKPIVIIAPEKTLNKTTTKFTPIPKNQITLKNDTVVKNKPTFPLQASAQSSGVNIPTSLLIVSGLSILGIFIFRISKIRR